MARTRRMKAAQTRANRRTAQATNGILTAEVSLITYHSASKNEITERVVKFLEARINRFGQTYFVVLDLGKDARRNLTPENIGWAIPAPTQYAQAA